MSTKKERDQLTELALTAWGSVAEILRERGETWPNTNVLHWGVGCQLAMSYVRGLTDALQAIGGPRLDQITDMYEERRGAAARDDYRKRQEGQEA